MTEAQVHPEIAARTRKWLGELPQGWESTRLGYVADIAISNVDKHTVEGEPLVRLCNYVDVYRNDSIVGAIDFMAATASQEQKARFRLRAGDTVITKDSETADDIGVPAYVVDAAEDLVCGYHLAIIRPVSTHIDSRYLYWALRSRPLRNQWEILASGVTRVGLRTIDLLKATVPLPPLVEQRKIANYLDDKVPHTDELINQQENMIALLKERRRGVRDALSHRVAGGDRLKWKLTEIDTRAGDLASVLPLLSVSIDWGVRRRSEFNMEPARSDDLAKYKLCKTGDIVVNRMRAFQGALGVAPVDGIVSPDYAVMRADESVLPSWLSEVMRTSRFIGEIVLRLRGIGSTDSGKVRTPRINVDDLLDIRLDIPELSSQRTELKEYERKTRRIDKATHLVSRHSELVVERREAMISELVSGRLQPA